MKRSISIGFSLSLLLPALVLAGPPMYGVYNSNDIGGTMLTGRFSESYVGGGPGQVGNTIHALSYDTVNLGTQWRVQCPQIASPPTVISDTRVNGTGDVVYSTIYTGGTFWLAKNGPWGDNVADYTGTIVSFSNVATYQFVGGTLIGIRSNVTLSGTFDSYPGVMEFAISNSATFGDTSTQPFPAVYPDLRDQSCAPGPTQGAWGSVPNITMVIQEVVGVDEASFGTLKARF
jgi:hypothetical protein